MTQSKYEIDVEYQEGGHAKMPTAVINIDINGKEYIMDLITYNENIEAGRTMYVELGDTLRMVTPEQYELLKEAVKMIKK